MPTCLALHSQPDRTANPMKKRWLLLLAVSHGLVLAAGFALGIYALPILIAPPPPDASELAKVAKNSGFIAEFSRDRKDSDALHWGEGEVTLGADGISFIGALAPGPDYKLYLSPVFVETEADFNQSKSSMIRVGEVKTFDSFLVPLPADVDLSKYNTVIVWCETFAQFITSARYSTRTGS